MSVRGKIKKDGGEKLFDISETPAGDALLDRLESKGLRMPFGCRSGSCGACLVLVKSGAESLSPVDAVERDTLERCGHGPTARLACRVRVQAGANVELNLEIPESEETIY